MRPPSAIAHAATVGVVLEGADVLDGGVGDLRRLLVELDGRVRDVTAARDLARAVGEYGLTTAVTPGTLATSAKSFSMRACTAAVRATPPAWAKTIWPSSPARAGNRVSSSCAARADSVSVREKPWEKDEPTLEPITLTATRATIHSTTTLRRRR